MIKCVFIDIDGTLVNDDKIVTDNTKEAIKKCIDSGINIILASGRSRLDTMSYQKEIYGTPYIISSNGANIYDIQNKKNIYIEPIQKEIVLKLFKYAQNNDYKIALNYNTNLVMNKNFYSDEKENVRTEEELINIINNEDIAQCVISNRELEKMQEFRKYLRDEIPEVKIENESKRLNNPTLKPSKHYYCDITNKDISKGKAVKILCKHLNLKKNEIVVIGDGENDISMFAEAEFSVAMENATEEVKKNADYVTSSNEEDGVARVLEKILLKNFSKNI